MYVSAWSIDGHAHCYGTSGDRGGLFGPADRAAAAPDGSREDQDRRGGAASGSVERRSGAPPEEIDNGIWNVFFGPLKVGRLLERYMMIEDAYGRLKRHDR